MTRAGLIGKEDHKIFDEAVVTVRYAEAGASSTAVSVVDCNNGVVKSLTLAAALHTNACKDEFCEAKSYCRSGSGGNGETVIEGKGRYVPNFKYKPGGRAPKQLWLPAADPANGADGGHVLCDHWPHKKF